MNLKLFSILILNVNLIFSSTCIIKNDGIARLFVMDPNSGNAVLIEPNETERIDTTLKGIKKLFVNETLNFFEEEKINSKHYTLKYQLRDNDLSRKSIELSYNQLKKFAHKSNHDLVITSFNSPK